MPVNPGVCAATYRRSTSSISTFRTKTTFDGADEPNIMEIKIIKINIVEINGV